VRAVRQQRRSRVEISGLLEPRDVAGIHEQLEDQVERLLRARGDDYLIRIALDAAGRTRVRGDGRGGGLRRATSESLHVEIKLSLVLAGDQLACPSTSPHRAWKVPMQT
jgi:hypothetical protein